MLPWKWIYDRDSNAKCVCFDAYCGSFKLIWMIPQIFARLIIFPKTPVQLEFRHTLGFTLKHEISSSSTAQQTN